jgi:hypothetical protein
MDLLKWKFPHMNSVDFQLRVLPGQEPQLLLLHPRGNRDYQLKPLEGGWGDGILRLRLSVELCARRLLCGFNATWVAHQPGG